MRELDRKGARLVLVGLAIDIPSQLVLAAPLAWSSLAYRGSGVVANGLYTVALFQALRRVQLPLALHRGGLVVVALGAAVSLASLTLHPVALFLSTGALTLAMIAWSAGLGVWAWQRS